MLTDKQIDICRRTMSANAFYFLVMDALEQRADLSVVRAADGEKKLYLHCRANPTGILTEFGGLTEAWFQRYGCSGIPRQELLIRIEDAVSLCTYFAPSISGIRFPAYDIYDTFEESNGLEFGYGCYVDNFFPNLWSEQQKIELFRKAGKVLLIHGNAHLAALMKERASKFGVTVHWIELNSWRQSEGIIHDPHLPKCPLTIFSAGPASKYIGPRLPGVTLDIGEAAKRWTFDKP